MASKQQDTAENVSRSKRLSRLRGFIQSRKWWLLIGLIAIAVVSAGVVYFFNNRQDQASVDEETIAKINDELANTNKYLQEENTAKALEHARKALAYSPNDVDLILTTADIAKKDNAEDTKELYKRALDEFKKQDNPDEGGKKPATYWAAGALAEDAGLTEEAKKYYQKVIDVAKPFDSDEQNLLKKAQAALERLK